MKFFNTAGPINPKDHYCLNPLSRFNLEEILSLILQKKYFVLHAPRQTGKTSCLLSLRDYLNTRDHYYTLYINVESGQTARENVRRGIQAVITQLTIQEDITFRSTFFRSQVSTAIDVFGEDAALGALLSSWCRILDRPLILLIDEIDALVGDTLISVLRQLRTGYTSRPHDFPSSVILCGVRDVRDYRIYSDLEKSSITGGSAFNIKAKSLRLGNFSKDETVELCLQHTKETGQIFEPGALNAIWDNSQGQPWLVNALAYEVCFEFKITNDRSVPITSNLVEEAKNNLIIRHETHLDQLADKLKEERVRRVIEPMLEGTEVESTINDDDISYVLDLGLITKGSEGLQIANPIYREVIPRQLTSVTSYNLEASIPRAPFIQRDGRLDTRYLFEQFQQFYRENSGSWLEIAQYREASPQLLLQAFLQRIVNGGGRIEREYGLGRGRLDLLVIWPGLDRAVQRIVIECKILRGTREKTIREGIAQTFRYADTCGAEEAHLVIFDRTEGKTWEEKLFCSEEIYTGTPDHQVQFPVTVWGM
ncbi:MAG: ATP-binding protein [Methanospirillum sp.]|uniref:AAA-like domain-containing protein n=1 Tax=Methanospirillum sp. TaxID=45200 RepID=UPI0023721D6B|nr:AAA-like domain-containing protein [Methanospirillum sp.]MDD1729853.1 ATP-binding protein [Methanospirillum sp.]